jgi:GNAT acetyltransferase-like protein
MIKRPRALTCRLARVEELERVAAFSRRAAGVEIPPAYWRWRYYENPVGASGIAIAEDGEEIVGLMSAFAVPFRLDGRQVLASQMGHNDVLKSHRSANAYFQLATTVFRELVDRRGIEFCYGVSIKETRDLSIVMMGFEEVGPIAKLVKVLNPVPHLRKRWGLPLPRRLGALRSLGTRRRARLALRGFTGSRFDHFSEVDDAGWKDASPRKVFASRDPSYLEWRYVECPLQHYQKLQLRSGHDLVGFLVYHPYEEEGVRYGVLDECFSLAEGGVRPLVDLAIAELLDRDVDAVMAWATPSTALHRSLLDHGFVSRPSPRSLIVRPLAEGTPDSVLAAEESWYYTVGDTEYWLFPVMEGFGEG